jgi:predicted enzyme related to lactoylglutathione lyase
MAKNTFCHIEFQCTDMKRAQAFYEGLFEWTFRSFGDEMTVFGVGDQHLGGLQKTDHVTPGASPSVWLEVDSIENYLAKAQKLGGKVGKEKSPVPGVGHSAMVTDPDGNHVGIVQFETK